MADTLEIYGITYNNVAGIKATDSNGTVQTYIRPSGTKQISISQNGTTTEDVAEYANAEITVSVSGGGGSITAQDIYDGTFPSGDVVINNKTITGISLYGNTVMTSFKSNSITQFKASSAFYGCTALKEVELTATVSQMQANLFQNCTALETLKIPSLNTTFPTYGAGGCTSLAFADLGNCTQIIANAFNGCTALNTLVLRRSSVCALQNVSAFNNTPFKSGGTGGTIYVPASLISSYQTASNWSTIHGYGTITWEAIEGSVYEL